MARRWMWLAAGLAAGALVGVRVANATGRAEEDRPDARPAEHAAAPAAAASAPASRLTRRAAPPAGYAAEAALSASRLPPEERAARAFLRTAAIAARVEAEASRLAATRAEGEGVREFAAQLVKYHAAADVELLWLLQARAMAAPMLETPQRKALSRLGKLDGARFDRAYVELVSARRQRSDVQEFERAAADLSDPVIKAWIERQLPALREQHAGAQRLASGRTTEVAQASPLRLTRTIASNSRSRASGRPAPGRS